MTVVPETAAKAKKSLARIPSLRADITVCSSILERGLLLLGGNLVLLNQFPGARVEPLAVDAELRHVGFPFGDRRGCHPLQFSTLLGAEGQRGEARIALHFLLG